MPKSHQEVFDIVASHLMNQGKRAIGAGTNMCAYRGEDGRMCAVGCLIPDEIYDPEIEGTALCYQNPKLENILSEVLKFPSVVDFRNSVIYNLLVQMQTIHDQSMSANWKDNLTNYARAWRLTLPDCLKD